MPALTQTAQLRQVLQTAHTIAVLGAHPDPTRAASYVPAYMHAQGARILPVNPVLTGQSLHGQPVRATLAELHEPVDVVDVFRRSSSLPDHLDDILAMQPPPRVVWLQSGIRNETFARKLVEAGIDVVQDACMLALHRQLGLGRLTRNTDLVDTHMPDS